MKRRHLFVLSLLVCLPLPGAFAQPADLAKIGTSLDKPRFPTAVFQGTATQLAEASLEVTPVGPICLDPIGDHQQPLKPCGSR